MLFASDLDRTLIYSDRFLKEDHVTIKAVEQGGYTSYMTLRAAELVQFIAAQILFVPCTTRTIEQYQRIQFFQNEVSLKYVVASNGGNLLINGAVDQTYRQKIDKELRQNCLPADDLIKEFSKITTSGWIEQIKEADQLFFYCLIDRSKTPFDELRCFDNWAAKQNWQVSAQGRKLYLVPKVVNKWAAVKEILNRTGEREVFAAGDSLLDLQMLNGASYSFCPQHGELYDRYRQTSNEMALRFTDSPGITAAEEILTAVIRWTDSTTDPAMKPESKKEGSRFKEGSTVQS